jgi:hypothetical protein
MTGESGSSAVGSDSQVAQNLVDQIDQPLQDVAAGIAVQQVGDRAEQVAEQVPGAWHRGDGQMHLADGERDEVVRGQQGGIGVLGVDVTLGSAEQGDAGERAVTGGHEQAPDHIVRAHVAHRQIRRRGAPHGDLGEHRAIDGGFDGDP